MSPCVHDVSQSLTGLLLDLAVSHVYDRIVVSEKKKKEERKRKKVR